MNSSAQSEVFDASRLPNSVGFLALRGVLLVGGLFVLLLANIAIYYPFLVDDALISLRYSQNLLDGNGLTWNTGERVEGYSDLLWVLAVSAVGKLGIDLIVAARLLALAGMLGAITGIVYGARRINASLTDAAIAGLFFVFSAPIGIWAAAGLEQPFVMAFLSLGLAAVWKLLNLKNIRWHDGAAAGVWFALLALTRPDGMMFPVVIWLAIALYFGRRREWKSAICAGIGILGLPLTAYLAQLAFRLSYYGDFVPNTARVKVALSVCTVVMGLRYVAVNLLPLLPPLVAVGIGQNGSARDLRSARFSILVAAGAALCLYLTTVGGDIFPGGRHFTAFYVLLSFAIVDVLVHNSGKRRNIIIALVLISPLIQLVYRSNRRYAEEDWIWHARPIAMDLKQAFGDQQPLMAVDHAGCYPYWTGFPCIDILGLCDGYISRHHPPAVSCAGLGVQISNSDYVLQRQPDIIKLGPPFYGLKPMWPSEFPLFESSTFRSDYSPAFLETDDPKYAERTGIWFRTNSPKIGIRRKESEIAIPGYLLHNRKYEEPPFTSDPISTIKLGSDGKFAVGIRPDQTVVSPPIQLPAGTWRVSVDSTQPVAIDLIADPAKESHWRIGESNTFKLPAAATVRVELHGIAPQSQPVEVKLVTLTREATELPVGKN